MKIIKVIKENFGLRIYLADNHDEMVFVKDPISEKGLQMNKREYANQSFLWGLSQKNDLGFKFLKPVLFDGKLIFPYLGENFEWLGSLEKNLIKPITAYFNELVKFIIYCHDKINYAQLPQAIKNDSLRRNTQNSKNKFQAHANYLLSNKIITTPQLSDLRKKFLSIADVRAFQHHDPMPWHMAKDKKTNDIYLVDSGWSGWSLWAYDISYFMLQMIGYGNELKAPKNFYQKIKKIHANKQNFDQLLKGALAYRGVRLLAELHRNKKIKYLKKIKTIIINGKF